MIPVAALEEGGATETKVEAEDDLATVEDEADMGMVEEEDLEETEIEEATKEVLVAVGGDMEEEAIQVKGEVEADLKIAEEEDLGILVALGVKGGMVEMIMEEGDLETMEVGEEEDLGMTEGLATKEVLWEEENEEDSEEEWGVVEGEIDLWEEWIEMEKIAVLEEAIEVVVEEET